MASNSLGRGSMTGYVPAGREVRADAPPPRPPGPVTGAPEVKGGFIGGLDSAVPAPSGRPVFSEGDKEAIRGVAGDYLDSLGEGPAYGGAAWNGGGGPLANAISGTTGAPKAILGAVEDVL
jgi:hypothetical protein